MEALPLGIDAIVVPGTMPVPLTSIPTARLLLLLPKVRACVPLSVAGLSMVIVVLGVIVTIFAPAGIPGPATAIPTTRAGAVPVLTDRPEIVVLPAVSVPLRLLANNPATVVLPLITLPVRVGGAATVSVSTDATSRAGPVAGV